jgi:hypothetical protein
MTSRLPLVLGPTGLPEQLQAGDTLSGVSGSGTVTSVTLTLPSFLNVSPATITTAGTFAVTLASQAPNVVLSGPASGGSATPTFRALVAADLPTATTLAKGAVRPDGTTITIVGDVISASGGATGSGVNLTSTYGLVGDGVTDNATAFLAMTQGLRTLGLHKSPGDWTPGPNTYNKTITATFTSGTPGTVSTPHPHGLRAGDPVVFSGSPPSPLVAGTVYYTSFFGMTATDFQLISVDPWTLLTNGNSTIYSGFAYPTSINFGSGTATVYFINQELMYLTLDPGNYFTSSNAQFAGLRNFILNAYGSIISGAGASFGGGSNAGFTYGGFFPYGQALLKPTSPGQPYVDVISPPSALFYIGGWMMLGALDTMNTLGQRQSTPFNPAIFEYLPIKAINPGAGVGGSTRITLGFTTGGTSGRSVLTKRGYVDTAPQYLPFQGIPYAATDLNTSTVVVGPGVAVPLPAFWDSAYKILGLRVDSYMQNQFAGRDVALIDCRFSGDGAVIGQSQDLLVDNTVFGDGQGEYSGIVIDKGVERATIRSVSNCDTIQVEGAGPNFLTIDNCDVLTIAGTGRNTTVRNSNASNGIQLGQLGFGRSESIYLENSVIGNFQIANRLDNTFTFMALNNWTFSKGVFSIPEFYKNYQSLFQSTNFANSWAVPGSAFYLNDMANAFDNMGGAGKILNVTRTFTTSHAVSVSAASPAVVHWVGHSLAAGTIVMFQGAETTLPLGLHPFYPYAVITVDADNFQLGDALASPTTAINTTGSLANVTIYVTPTFNMQTTLTAVPAATTVVHTFTATNATPCVFTTGTNVPNDTPVIFKQQEALLIPTGFYPDYVYWVVNSNGATTFQLSRSKGGAAVASTSTQSGSPSVVLNPLKFNPHACPRITAVDCTGHPRLNDQSYAPRNTPLFSYATKTFYGQMLDTSGYFNSPMYVWGNLKQMTIYVPVADTVGSGTRTLTITAAGFDGTLAAANLSQVIDTTTAGTRIITPTAHTTLGADTTANYGNWISGNVTCTFADTSGQDFNKYPQVRIEIETDQGIWTNSGTYYYQDPNYAHVAQVTDTTFPTFGSVPE